MKRSTINTLLISLATLLITACSDEDIVTNGGTNQEISFLIGFSDETNIRVTTDERFKTTFEQGDEIGIFVYKRNKGQNSSIENNQLYVDNRKMTYDGSSWQLESPIYYSDDGTLLDIYAYYPYQEGAMATALKYDAHTEMVDLLSASALGIKKEAKTTPLIFSHLLSLLHISIDKTEKIPDFDEFLRVYFNGVVSGEYNLSTNEINNPEKGAVEMILAGPADPYQRTYRAWVPAQKITSGIIFSFIQTDLGNEFSQCKEVNKQINLTQGRIYKSHITLDQEFEKGVIYELYDPYPKYGIPIGLVVKVSNEGRSGTIISLINQGPIEWSNITETTRCTDTNDGISNKMKLQNIPNWITNYPAFWACTLLGERWYLPAAIEARDILCRDIENINYHLRKMEVQEIIPNMSYFTSTEDSEKNAYKVYTGNADIVSVPKTDPFRIRALYDF